MQKNLVFILPNLAIGGAENMVYELCRNIDPSTYNSSILCYGSKRNTALEKKMEALVPVTYLGLNARITLFDILRVLKELSRLNANIVHSHMGGTLFAALWTGIHRKPLVVTVHTTPEKAFSNKVKKVLKWRLKKPNCIIVAVSEKNKELTQKYYNLGTQCRCVNNGVDVDKFYRKQHDHFTYINVARQDDNKNQSMLLEAFQKVNQADENTRLILIGDGPNHQKLVAMCKELGTEKSVMLPGNVPDVENYYSQADVYVQTSYREGLPLSVLEAMAAGLPIVSTDVGGLKDVVHENGVLIPAGDLLGLIAEMTRIKNMSVLERNPMSIKSIKMVEQYSSSKMGLEYMKLYSEMMEEC